MEQAPQTNSWKYYPAGKYFSSKYLTQNTTYSLYILKWMKNAQGDLIGVLNQQPLLCSLPLWVVELGLVAESCWVVQKSLQLPLSDRRLHTSCVSMGAELQCISKHNYTRLFVEHSYQISLRMQLLFSSSRTLKTNTFLIMYQSLTVQWSSLKYNI